MKKLTLILFLLTILSSANAEEINLPAKDEKVYASSENRLYDLKIKLKPKVIESRVYWQGREKTNWEEEIRNWKTGLLTDEIIPPLIIDKEGFYPEEDLLEKFFWGKDKMRFLVFNPLSIELNCGLEFLANSYKKNRGLKFRINDKEIKKLEIPCKEEFNKIEIKDIFLIPGINKIEFHCLEGADKLKSDLGEKGGKIRQVSIKFKEFRFKDLKVSEAAEVKGDFDNLRIVSQDNFLDLIFLPNRPIILSRDLDIDLEEFPLFNFKVNALKEIEANVIIAFGIDYTGDGTVDDYLNLEEFGEHNLFELAKEKWQEVSEYENIFMLKKIFLLVYPKKENEDLIGILRLNDFNFYNDSSLVLVKNERLEMNQLFFENINVNSEVIERDGVVNVISYFDGAPLSEFKEEKSEDFSKNRKITSQKREEEEVRVRIPLNDEEVQRFPLFSFKYILDNSDIQEIKPAVLIRENNQDKLVDLDENFYDRLDNTIEVNLKNFRSPNAIILRFRRRDDADCSPPEKKGWYPFRLSEIRFYEKFPCPIKSGHLEERFLSLLKEINPQLIKIDGEVFRLNDFQVPEEFKDLERETLAKRTEFKKGNHKYEKLENSVFDMEWAILEPVHSPQSIVHSKEEPEITFKKINPTKYLVKVSGAKSPFWLVFSESFHKQWRLYKSQVTSHKSQEINEIVADYPKLKVKEAKHLMKFTPQDIKFLFESPMEVPHHLANGYANGWYIEPERLKLDQDFTLVLYFWPQSLFYLGLGISGLTLLGCISYLVYGSLRKIKGK